eukprot:2586538-Rhodomonas_salina.1
MELRTLMLAAPGTELSNTKIVITMRRKVPVRAKANTAVRFSNKLNGLTDSLCRATGCDGSMLMSRSCRSARMSMALSGSGLSILK